MFAIFHGTAHEKKFPHNVGRRGWFREECSSGRSAIEVARQLQRCKCAIQLLHHVG